MKTPFHFITKTTTAVSPSGRSIVEVSRSIRVDHLPPVEFAEKYLEEQGHKSPLNISWNETIYAPAEAVEDGWMVAYTFTPFAAQELPHYAKQLTQSELLSFKIHAEESNVVFVKDPT